MDNMTALVSCFARAYHCRNSNLPVFVDPVAEQMLTAEEYDTISRNMAQGIRYFAPGFKGTAEAIGMRFACEYPDETNGKTHVSVITREGWLNELTQNMISWAEDKLMAEDMDGYRTGDTPERK